MTEPNNRGEADDDTYVIEDNGETLESFDLESEQRAAQQEREDAGAIEVAEATPAMPHAAAELERQNHELQDRLLRIRADIDNLRKRTEREKQDFYRYALIDIMRELVPVLDNFERALAVKSESAQDILTGVELIFKQLSDILSKAGLRTIDEAGVPFDPGIHEAVARDEESALPAHSVAQILQKGYMLHDRLVRPAMVRVSVGGREPAETVPGEPEG